LPCYTLPIHNTMSPFAQKDRNDPSLDSFLQILADSLPYLQDRFKVREIGIVGSYARGEETEESDIDILVDFSEPIGWEVVDLKEYLEDILSHRVDLILKGGITNRPRLFQAMTRDVIYVKA